MSYLKSSDNCTVGTIRENRNSYNVLYIKLIHGTHTCAHTHIGTYIRKGNHIWLKGRQISETRQFIYKYMSNYLNKRIG